MLIKSSAATSVKQYVIIIYTHHNIATFLYQLIFRGLMKMIWQMSYS